MVVEARCVRISRALCSAAAPRDRSSSTGMSRRCSSPSADATVSAHTTETSAVPSIFSVSDRSCGGHPRYNTDFTGRGLLWGSWSGLIRRHEMAVTPDVHLDAGGAIRFVDQPAVGGAAMLRIESDRRQASAVVGFPGIWLAVAVSVLFGRHEFVLCVMFDA